MITIGIIGSSKIDDPGCIELWYRMVNTAEQYVSWISKGEWSQVHLISGGSSYSDHIAVRLYLEHPESKLTLHLPCKYYQDFDKFYDSGSTDWRTNSGRILNKYHSSFSKAVGINSLADITKAIHMGAEIKDDYKGFHDRNIPVGNADVLLAFTRGKDIPDSPGTLYTWNKSKCPRKIHITIPDGLSEITNY